MSKIVYYSIKFIRNVFSILRNNPGNYNTSIIPCVFKRNIRKKNVNNHKCMFISACISMFLQKHGSVILNFTTRYPLYRISSSQKLPRYDFYKV